MQWLYRHFLPVPSASTFCPSEKLYECTVIMAANCTACHITFRFLSIQMIYPQARDRKHSNECLKIIFKFKFKPSIVSHWPSIWIYMSVAASVWQTSVKHAAYIGKKTDANSIISSFFSVLLNMIRQRFSDFFQVGTTFISQNVLRTTLLLGLSNSLGLP